MADDVSYSTKWYRKKRRKLLKQIHPDGDAVCEECGDAYDPADGASLQFHHVDPDKGLNEPGFGGKNHLYKIEEQLEDGVELRVLCVGCHKQVHAGDGNYWKEVK